MNVWHAQKSELMLPTLLAVIRKQCGYSFPRSGPFFAFVRKYAPSNCEVELFPNIRVPLDLNDETHFQTYWYGTRYEQPTGQILTSWWKDAEYFFDIGANYGFFSLWAASQRNSIQIHSFEPNPETFAKLRHNVVSNGLSAITTHQLALSQKAGTLTFKREEENSGASHVIEEASPDEAAIVVNCRPFDDFTECLHLKPMSSVAKIDVEGMEMDVLQGMTQSLHRKIFRGLCVELLDENLSREGTSSGNVDSFLRHHGYIPQPGDPSTSSRKLHHNGFYIPTVA